MPGFIKSEAAKILNAAIRGAAYTVPAGCYLGLYSVAPDDNGTGGTELSGNGYGRPDVRAACGAAATSDSIANTVAVDTPTATGAWPAVVAFGLFAASSGGTPFAIGTCSLSALTTGQFHRFAIGAITATLE